MPTDTPQRVLVVGASSAIAGHVAREYARRGASLFLMARNRVKLDALAGELAANVRGTLVGDFDELEQAERRIACAIETLGAIDVAVLAHGLLPDQRETEASIASALAAITTNFTSAVAFLIPLANHMEAQRSGHIAVMTSVAGDRGRPRNYTYGSAKSATRTYLQGVRSRLYRAGVSVHDLRLGPVDTPMTIDHPKNPLFGDAEQVGRGIVSAIERDRKVVYLPWFWRWIMLGVRNLPEPLFQRFGFLSGR